MTFSDANVYKMHTPLPLSSFKCTFKCQNDVFWAIFALFGALGAILGLFGVPRVPPGQTWPGGPYASLYALAFCTLVRGPDRSWEVLNGRSESSKWAKPVFRNNAPPRPSV